jgi:alpha-tubulin suppressor-like RCC1 family protein
MKNLLTLFIVLSSLLIKAQNNQLSWRNISAGTEYSIAIATDGTLWSWGFNGNGQLGQGLPAMEMVYAPQQVGVDNDWKEIAAGGYHVLAIKENGTLWAWGLNELGQLGNGEVTSSNVPVQVGTDTDWSKVSASYVNSAALKTDGSLWTWGYSDFGQLGFEADESQTTPMQVLPGTTWLEIKLGGIHALAIKDDGTLHGWGMNVTNQLNLPASEELVIVPTQIGDDTWSSISAGFEFSMGIKTDGSLWSWGFNGNGQLAVGNTAPQDTMVQLGLGSTWDYVSAGSSFFAAIKSDKTLYGGGFNAMGQLGIGNNNDQLTLVQISPATDWSQVSCAAGANMQGSVFGMHMLAINDNGDYLCVAGANYAGQLGYTSNNQVDQLSCFIVLSTDSEKPKALVHVYPNPTTDLIQVNANGTKVHGASIFDLSGKLVINKVLNSSIATLNLEQLPVGIYHMKLETEAGVVVEKIVKL